MTSAGDLAGALLERFGDRFGAGDDPGVALAPGRVNLIGEHTDYNDGWALPMAIDRHVGVAFRPRADRRLRTHAVAFGETREVDLDTLRPPGEPGWISYVAGIAWALEEAGIEVRGVDCVIDGDVPLGAGLSSSAALEMATARALCAAAGARWLPKAMADLGRRADNLYVGVGSGCMDQLVSSCAEEGAALLLDCRTLETETVALPRDVAVVVMDTGSRRALAASEYNARCASCAEAVAALRSAAPAVRALRDVGPGLLEAARGRMSETAFRRARHVVDENLRPGAMAVALRDGALDDAGRLMNDSHASLRDLYGVSSPELDLITDLARRHAGCFGARLTGAGFGGCAVALVAADGSEAFVREVGRSYAARVDLPGEIFVAAPVAGARLHRPAAASGAPSPE